MKLANVDQLIRSRRKTIALIVERNGRLVVRAPLKTSQKEIQQLLDAKKSWIDEKQALARHHMRQHPPHLFQPGEKFLFLGQAYPLQIVTNAPELGRADDALTLSENTFWMKTAGATIESEYIKKHFMLWYRQQALQILPERVCILADRYAIVYQQVKISPARTRWGSCSGRGNINFTWRLIMAPWEAVDYVIIHELAHRIEPNHSAHFWKVVANMLPDYTLQVEWLRDNGKNLTLEDRV